MDAGLAAVCGALAGSLGTIGAALASGRAQRAGAEIAARAEHRKSRRDPREAAYKDYAASVAVLLDWEYYDDEPSQDDELHPLLVDIRKAWTEVIFAGPLAVKGPADRLMDACVAFRVAVRERAETDFDSPIAWVFDARGEIRVCLSLFVDTAQIALDDDGSRRRFRG
jgi:hypothetical protein